MIKINQKKFKIEQHLEEFSIWNEDGIFEKIELDELVCSTKTEDIYIHNFDNEANGYGQLYNSYGYNRAELDLYIVKKDSLLYYNLHLAFFIKQTGDPIDRKTYNAYYDKIYDAECKMVKNSIKKGWIKTIINLANAIANDLVLKEIN